MDAFPAPFLVAFELVLLMISSLASAALDTLPVLLDSDLEDLAKIGISSATAGGMVGAIDERGGLSREIVLVGDVVMGIEEVKATGEGVAGAFLVSGLDGGAWVGFDCKIGNEILSEDYK